MQEVQNIRKCGCILLVAIALTFVAATIATLVLYFFVEQQETRNVRLDIGLTEPWYFRRADWKAEPEVKSELLDLPLPHVLIGHSAMDHCTDAQQCISSVQDIQTLHFDRAWHDIGPNFLVGGNGIVFEGRGANFIAVMVSMWNRIGISVMFLGNYSVDEPTDAQFENVNTLLEELVRMNVLRPDYTVFGHCQVSGPTISPGQHVMESMHKFEHWDRSNLSLCLRSS